MSILSREKWEAFFRKKNLRGKDALEAVKRDGYELRYVLDQTPEICLAAVNENGSALQYVTEQTPEICLAAVIQDGFALQYVKEQTPEICLEAVKQDAYALEYVEERFLESEDEIVILNGQKYKLTKISGKVRLLVLEEEE